MNRDVARFMNKDGKVTTWPKKQSDKELVLDFLANKFKFEHFYHENEVNEILKEWHTFSDWPLLRRELYERDYLDRNISGTQYRRIM